jgi:hypothetical protein
MGLKIREELEKLYPDWAQVFLTQNDNAGESENDEFLFFPPFYPGDRKGVFCHFYELDVLLLFVWAGYEIIEMKNRGKRLYATLRYEDETIELCTQPDTFIIKLEIEGEVKELEVEGFSTKVHYKMSGMKESKPLELPEINTIFMKYMKVCLTTVFKDTPYIR